MHENGKHVNDDDDFKELDLLVEEKPANLVNSSPPHKPLNRNAWFIKSLGAPFFPSDHKVPIVFDFKDDGALLRHCKPPPSWWAAWVEKLRPIYGHLWRKSGIYDAIQGSLYYVRKDLSTILGVSAFWCRETNTFVFPWGEATVTLEDVLVLGGFSVIGEPLSKVLDDELELLDRRVNEVRRKFNNSTLKKASHKPWMEYFAEREADELEHTAFLALWLSRWVFPKHTSTVTQQVIPVAVRLAQGARIALAPVVLAALYSNLGVMKNCLLDNRYDEGLIMFPPFQILQVGIWEHFAELRPGENILADKCEPRVAKWHDVGKEMDISFVLSVLECPDKFQWRPYEFGLQEWCFRKREWMHGTESRDASLQSLAQFLNASMLVGSNTIEQYLPHRVAMQFGLDQEVPGSVRRVVRSKEAAWETYDLSSEDFSFDIELPKTRLEPGITVEYLEWWKQNVSSVTIYKIEGLKRHKHSSNKGRKVTDQTIVERKKRKKIKDQHLHLDKESKLEELDDVSLSAWLSVHKERIGNLKRPGKSQKVLSKAAKKINDKRYGKKHEVVEQKTKVLNGRGVKQTETHLAELVHIDELMEYEIEEGEIIEANARASNFEYEIEEGEIIEKNAGSSNMGHEFEEGEIIETSEDIGKVDTDSQENDSDLDKFSEGAELSLSSKQLQSRVQLTKFYEDKEGKMVEVIEIEDDIEDVNRFGKMDKAAVVDAGKTSSGEIQQQNFIQQNLSYKLGAEESSVATANEKDDETNIAKFVNDSAVEMEAHLLIDSVTEVESDKHTQFENSKDVVDEEVLKTAGSTENGEATSESTADAALPVLASIHSSNNSMPARERWLAARELDMQIIKKLKDEIAAMDVMLKIERPK